MPQPLTTSTHFEFVSHKKNLTFEAGNVIWIPIDSRLSETNSFALKRFSSFRHFRHVQTTANTAKLTAIENTLVPTKSRCFPSFKLLNFSWTSTSLHAHTHSASRVMCTSLLCVFKSTHVITLTYTCVSQNCSPF